MANRPTIGEGDVGTDVKDLLNLLPTYYFDHALTEAVKDYQRSRGLDDDGIVGPQTWAALEDNAPPYVPPGLPPPLSQRDQDAIADIAANSDIADYSWDDRGQAPVGFTKGVALAFANTYRQLLVGYPPAVEMAKANTHDADNDVLAWEAGRFESAGMSNNVAGANTLRHLWVYILGLGLRESSGEHCCGRDQSASNTTSDTCEAGAWQTSYNAHNCSQHCDTLFDAFRAGAAADHPQGFLDFFSEDVECSSADWECYGSGDGYAFQEMEKRQPAFAAEFCGVVLRNLRQHYGPVNRREVEIMPSANVMLQEVQAYLDRTATAGARGRGRRSRP